MDNSLPDAAVNGTPEAFLEDHRKKSFGIYDSSLQNHCSNLLSGNHSMSCGLVNIDVVQVKLTTHSPLTHALHALAGNQTFQEVCTAFWLGKYACSH